MKSFQEKEIINAADNKIQTKFIIKGGDSVVISFIGLGEVGSTYSSGLAKKGVIVKGYDLLFETKGKDHFIRCEKSGVILVDSPEELVRDADIIIAVTSGLFAMETAKTIKPYLTGSQIYVELNSATPDIKKEVEDYLGDKCKFVDGTTLSSPSQLDIMTPIILSGPYGKKTAIDLNSYGMDIQYLGNKNGQASAFKAIRSIFTKGLESTLIECLAVAKNFDIEDNMFKSIVSFLSDEPTEETLELLVETDVLHAKRRADEILEISKMIESLNFDNTMAAAAAKKLYYLSDINLRDKFDNKKAENMMDVIDAVLEFEKNKE